VSEPNTPRNARVFIGPDRPASLLAAVKSSGATLAPAADANIVVWTSGTAAGIESVLHAGVEWVQLPAAGIETWLASGFIDDTRAWTSARGLYGARVAEHVVALILAAAKGLLSAARHASWKTHEVELLEGATVGIIGAGGIGTETLRRLEPFGVRRIGLTRSGATVPDAEVSLGPDQLPELLRESEYVVLAAPLTRETKHLIGSRELALLGSHGWLINVARGRLVDTEALVAAVRSKTIAGACLDVTDPEPLADDHPLWRCENVLITSHAANPWARHDDLLAARLAENLDRFLNGVRLLGAVDVVRGY
jgi:phosphoglycerate dehydrogenase-like enzyme